MIWFLYIENPQNSGKKKTVRIINKFRKVAVYKINMPNQLPNVKRKFFLKASKRIKYLVIKLNKEMKKPVPENYKTLLKIQRRTEINGKTFCAHDWIFNIAKRSLLLKRSTDSLQSLPKYQQWFFFCRKKKIILKFMWILKEPDYRKQS